MELIIPYLLIILSAPVPGELDRGVEEVRITMSQEACETLRTKLRLDDGASQESREMICVPLPSGEEFERAFQESR